MPVYLKDLPVADLEREFRVFNESERIASLGWPGDVVEQWLYYHGHYGAFLEDYGNLDLTRIRWNLEDVRVTDLERIPTGPSEHDAIEAFAVAHRYWLSKRPEDVRVAWQEQGSWRVPPILISRELLDPPGTGLQVIEGRTRVGILQGRRAAGLKVADSHKAWVGRAVNGT